MKFSLKKLLRSKGSLAEDEDLEDQEDIVPETEEDVEEIIEVDELDQDAEDSSDEVEAPGLDELDRLISQEAQKAQPAPVAPTSSATMDDDETPSYLEDAAEGQLAVDVYQTEGEIVIKSTIAGVRAEDLDVSINNDMVTIKGTRRHDSEVLEENYFLRECYWGSFSRSIILPVEVRQEKIQAALKDGVLTIRLPKLGKARAKVIKVASESD